MKDLTLFQKMRVGPDDESGEIALINSQKQSDPIHIAYKNEINHVVQKTCPTTTREIRAARLFSRNPEKFFEFPISSVLFPRSAGREKEKESVLLERALSCYEDKKSILDSILELFLQGRLNSSLRDDVRMTADEFLTNVLFNSMNDKGVNINSLAESILKAKIPLPKPAILRVGASETHLAVSCLDRSGTLEPRRFLEKLFACANEGVGETINLIDRGTAGVGGFLIFNACVSLYVGVKTGEATLFCALFPLKGGARIRTMSPKNLHWRAF